MYVFTCIWRFACTETLFGLIFIVWTLQRRKHLVKKREIISNNLIQWEVIAEIYYKRQVKGAICIND